MYAIRSYYDFTKSYAGIPALLAVSGLHHHLIRKGLRGKADIILDSGEPSEVHHFATLVGYGVSAVHPYLAYRMVEECVRITSYNVCYTKLLRTPIATINIKANTGSFLYALIINGNSK